MNQNINVPAEWEQQNSIWTAWPSDAELWQENLEPARGEVAAMIMGLITPHNGKKNRVNLLVTNDEACESAKQALPSEVKIHQIKFGDIWLRDTGPIFAKQGNETIAKCFGFNGWGGKYVLDYDDMVNIEIAKNAQTKTISHDFILEGGSIENNGNGIILTTRQCLLNPNRNPNLDIEKCEAALKEYFGAKKILWLNDGLLNDHTDGHIDNIARFIGPNRIICQSPASIDDPNYEILEKIHSDLLAMTNLENQPFEIIRAPSPGQVLNEEGEIVPASHMNFIIGNGAVIMPHYGTNSADEALRILAQCFPNHKIIGIRANAVLTGGGSFHCITQQQPA